MDKKYNEREREREVTCIVVSLMTKPPAETVFTNSCLSFLSLVNKYAARGFVPEFMISKLSSSLSTCSPKSKEKEMRKDSD